MPEVQDKVVIRAGSFWGFCAWLGYNCVLARSSLCILTSWLGVYYMTSFKLNFLFKVPFSISEILELGLHCVNFGGTEHSSACNSSEQIQRPGAVKWVTEVWKSRLWKNIDIPESEMVACGHILSKWWHRPSHFPSPFPIFLPSPNEGLNSLSSPSYLLCVFDHFLPLSQAQFLYVQDRDNGHIPEMLKIRIS